MVTGINRSRPYVNIALAAVNVLVFLYLEAIGSTEDGVFMVKHGAVFAPFVILGGEYYRLFTAMFLHFGVSHLANNMLVLLVLGEKMERALGHIKYLIFYLASGVAANSISLAVQVRTGQASVSAGASGAIFGVVGGLVYVIAIHHGQLDGLTNRQLGFMVLLTLYHGFTSAGVDNMAHIGGLISGFILGILLYRRKYAARIYEDQDFRVILDLGPASRGHALILPKQHFADVCALDGDIAAKVLPLGAKIGSAMKKSLGCAGFNLVQNNGEAAGQTVFHFHMHVIPRYEGGPDMVSWTPGKASPEELAEVADKIKGCL